ncbi:MAG: hypothetical protein BWK80_03605 [Desulfobacteraceae bacterium IS3]|nr:MAG: hypothetical protein BWK80_03605 [Desulfobacteraceae bacterium IS3]
MFFSEDSFRKRNKVRINLYNDLSAVSKKHPSSALVLCDHAVSAAFYFCCITGLSVFNPGRFTPILAWRTRRALSALRADRKVSQSYAEFQNISLRNFAIYFAELCG